MTEMGRICNAYRRTQTFIRFFSEKFEGKRPLRRSRRRWEDNIEMNLKEMGCDARNRIDLAQDRDKWRVYVRAVVNLWIP